MIGAEVIAIKVGREATAGAAFTVRVILVSSIAGAGAGITTVAGRATILVGFCRAGAIIVVMNIQAGLKASMIPLGAGSGKGHGELLGHNAGVIVTRLAAGFVLAFICRRSHRRRRTA